MVIQWYGQSCFKVSSGDLVLVTDPFSKEIGLTPPRFKTDIVTVSHSHYDHSNAESLAGDPFLISGAGEYEAKGVYIQGLETFHDDTRGKERGMNTIYKIEMEDMKLLHLGDLGERELREETLNYIGDIDILMTPVGGKYTIDGAAAAKIVQQVEPRYVIPMHYKIPGLKIDLAGVDPFLKEQGRIRSESQEKFVVKKKDIGEEEKTEVIVLKPV